MEDCCIANITRPVSLKQRNQSSSKNAAYEQARKLKVQIWSSVVNIVVIEGKNLSDKEGELLSKPYLRLRYAH